MNINTIKELYFDGCQMLMNELEQTFLEVIIVKETGEHIAFERKSKCTETT